MRHNFLILSLAVAPAWAATPPPLDPSAFERAPVFASQCSPLMALPNLTEDQEIAQIVCSSFVQGVVGGMVAATKYEVGGERVCADPTNPAVVFDRAAQLVRLEPEKTEKMTSAELIVATYIGFNPCPAK